MIETICVKTWDDLEHELLYDNYRTDIQRYRSNYIFRGLTRADYDLKTSLQRVCQHNMKLEVSLLRNFQKFASDFTRNNSFWENVALAQHHGLPTRLLDWTNSPFVALHFATDKIEHMDYDSTVWMLDTCEVRASVPPRALKALDQNSAYVFSIDMLANLYPDFDSMKTAEVAGKPFILIFEPPSIDSRIVNQYAQFAVMSDADVVLEDWLNNDNRFRARKIIIPASLKWYIRDFLDQMNMTERTIYPGLDGLSKWLTRYYSKKL